MDPNAGRASVNLAFSNDRLGKAAKDRTGRGKRSAAAVIEELPARARKSSTLRQIAADDTCTDARLAQHGTRIMDMGELNRHNCKHMCCRECAGDWLVKAVVGFAQQEAPDDYAIERRARRFAQAFREDQLSKVPALLHTSEKLMGHASRIDTSCTRGHEYKLQSSPLVTVARAPSAEGEKIPQPRSGGYEINIRMGVASLDTGVDAVKMEKIAAYQNRPLPSNYTNHLFGKSSMKAGVHVRAAAEESMQRAHAEEAALEIEAAKAMGFKGGRVRVQLASGEEIEAILVSGGFDVHWPKRSSGHTFDSCGGVGFLVLTRTGKVGWVGVESKHCAVCMAWRRKHKVALAAIAAEEAAEAEGGGAAAAAVAKPPPVREHTCTATHYGRGSKSMEPKMAVRMCEEAPERFGTIIGWLGLDDDATCREWTRHEDPDDKTCKGKLSVRIPEPDPRADPSHRFRTARTHFYEMFKLHTNVEGESWIKSDSKSRGLFVRALCKMYAYAVMGNRSNGLAAARKAIAVAADHVCKVHGRCPRSDTEGGWCNAWKDDYLPSVEFHGAGIIAKIKECFTSEPLGTPAKVSELLMTDTGALLHTQKNEGINRADCERIGKYQNLAMSARMGDMSHLTALEANEGRLAMADVIERCGVDDAGIFTRAILYRQQKRNAKKRKHEGSRAARFERKHKRKLKTREEARLARLKGEGDAYGHAIAVLGRGNAPKGRVVRERLVPCEVCGVKFFVDQAGMRKSQHLKRCRAAQDRADELMKAETSSAAAAASK